MGGVGSRNAHGAIDLLSGPNLSACHRPA